MVLQSRRCNTLLVTEAYNIAGNSAAKEFEEDIMTTTTTLPNVNAVQGGNPLQGLLAYGQSPWLDLRK